MNINAMVLNQLIGRSNIHLEDRKYIIAMALGKNIAYELSLPSSATLNYSQWFTECHGDTVKQILQQVNELCIINIQEVYDMIFNVWKMRYKMVYDCKSIEIMTLLDNAFQCGSNDIQQVYRRIFDKVGEGEVNGFIKDVGWALTSGQGE